MFSTTISAILRGPWLIDRAFANDHLPIILGILQGKLSGTEFLAGSGEFERPFVVNHNGKRVDAFFKNHATGRWTLDEKLFENGSIGVVPIIGPVMKYNGSCGESGMVQRQAWISELMSSPKIVGLASVIDSPGGQADGTPQFADFIKSLSKPTAAIINGGAYSGGAWSASAHDHVYLANDYSGIGSIGAYTTIVDYRGYFKKQGYNVKSIYPDESRDKNLSYRKAIDGDESLIKEEVAELARFFISAFAENRSGLLTSEEWNTGKTFKGSEALRIGLADGIKSFDETIAELRGDNAKVKPLRFTSSVAQNQNLNNHEKMEFENIAALSEVEDPTQEQIDKANGDLTTANITKVTLVKEEFITEAAGVTTERDGLKEANSKLTTDLAAAVAAKDSAVAENVTLKEKISKRSGADLSQKTDLEETSQVSESAELDKELAELPHNASIANNPLFG